MQHYTALYYITVVYYTILYYAMLYYEAEVHNCANDVPHCHSKTKERQQDMYAENCIESQHLQANMQQKIVQFITKKSNTQYLAGQLEYLPEINKASYGSVIHIPHFPHPSTITLPHSSVLSVSVMSLTDPHPLSRGLA